MYIFNEKNLFLAHFLAKKQRFSIPKISDCQAVMDDAATDTKREVADAARQALEALAVTDFTTKNRLFTRFLVI